MSDQELGQEGITSSGSLGPPGPDVLLRMVVPPYRLGEMLLHIGEQKLTGRLALATDMGRRTILFHSGFPVFTQSSLFAERMGAIGVRHGFFGRQDVARALSFARDRKVGLGEALLELGYVNPARLYALLGVQLREVVAAACGSEPLRARFQSGPAALRDVAVMRMHPLTAVLAAVASLPNGEASSLLQSLLQRRLGKQPLPAIAQRWLVDLGFVGAQQLGIGDVYVSAVRGRLLARYMTGAERAFDAAQVSFAFPGTRVMASPITPASVADLVTLTLLLSGALRLGDAAPRVVSDDPPSVGDTLRAALEQATERPLAEGRPSLMPPPNGAPAVDHAIEGYLHAPRDKGMGAALAVWGPSVEAADASVPPELLRMYLTLKPEKRPNVVLGVSADATAEQIMEAYARRAELVASMTAEAPASAHLSCRIAELGQRFDDALGALVPGAPVARHSLPPVAAAPAAGTASEIIPPPAKSSDPAPAAASGEAIPSPVPPRGDTRIAARIDALTQQVDANLRAGNFGNVLDALDAARLPDTSLPFNLLLSRAIAQRELEGRRRARPLLIAAVLIGAAIGYAIRHFGGDPAVLLY